MRRLIDYLGDKRRKNRQLNITYTGIFFWAISYSAFEYFVPIGLENNGYTYSMIGLLIALMSVFSIFTNFWFGYIQKSRTKRSLFTISLLLLTLSVILFSGNMFLPFAFLSMIIYGLGFDLFDITAYTSIYDNSKEKDRSVNISLRDVFENTGIIVGAVISGLLISLQPTLLNIVIIVSFFIAIIITSRYKNRVKKNRHKLFKELFTDIRKIGFSNGLFALVLIGMTAFWNGIFFAFEPLFAQQFSTPFIDEVILGGLLLGTYVLPIISFEYAFGKLEDRMGRKRFAVMGILIASLSLIWLSQVKDIVPLFISVFLISTGIMAITNPAINGIYERFAVKNLGKVNDGDSVGFFEIFSNLGYIFGPILGGLMISRIGFFASFRTLGIIFFCFFLLSALFLKE